MIVLEHGVAYNVTPDEYRILLADRAAGLTEPMDCYGFEVGECVGDFSRLTQDDARAYHKALEDKLAGKPDLATGELRTAVERVAGVIAEESMSFPLPDKIQAA